MGVVGGYNCGSGCCCCGEVNVTVMILVVVVGCINCGSGGWSCGSK